MGVLPVSMKTEFRIVAGLLRKKSRKTVARECGVSVSTVAKVKAKWPLLFWNSRKLV